MIILSKQMIKIKAFSHSPLSANACISNTYCCAPLLEECPQHHGYKGDPRVTPETCGAIGERAQVILVWVRARGVENASHPLRLGVTRVMP